MNHRIDVGSLDVRIDIERPARRRGKPTAESMHIEVRSTQLQIWSGDQCGEIYTYDPAEADGRLHVSRPLSAMPDLDLIFRVFAEERATNRAGMVGAFLAAPVAAMESAIAARDGSSVYFADAGGNIKIGWSRKVASRLAKLQVGCASPLRLLGTMPGGRAVERSVHEQFAHLRLSGEWFNGTPELLAYIASVTDDRTTPGISMRAGRTS